jgi:cell wall-associated NlpC family hydrolase
MTLHQREARHLILSVARTQLGKPYSEQSPQGSDGDGHYWIPGEVWPWIFDCSGLTHTCGRAAGILISDGNADMQFRQHLGGIVPIGEPLLPADFGAFLGGMGVPGYAGHTGIVESFDVVTGAGVMINAYDTQYGVCRTPFQRGGSDNAQGVAPLGFYRPVNILPPDPMPVPDAVPPTQDEIDDAGLMRVSPEQRAVALSNGWALWAWSGHKFVGFPEPPDVATSDGVYANKQFARKRIGG